MDNKRLIQVVLLTTALMLLWMLAFPWFMRQLGYDWAARPEPPAQQTQSDDPVDPLSAQTQPSTAPSETPAPSATAPAATRPAEGALRVLNPAAERRSVILGAAEPDSPYVMEVTATNAGAGVEQVVLNQFRQEVDSEARYTFQQPYPQTADLTRPLATASVQIGGQSIDLSRALWQIDESQTSGEQVVFFLDIGGDEGAVARVFKRIRIYPRMSDGQSDVRAGYELLVEQRIENLTEQPLIVQSAMNGPTTPPRELEYGYDRMIIAGYRGRNQTVLYEAWQVEAFEDDEQKREIIPHEHGPLLWAGTSSIYFDAIVRPVPFDQQQGIDVPTADWLRQVVVASVNPEEERSDRRLVALRFFTSDLTAPPGGAADVDYRVFFGPKERGLLKNPYFSSPAMRYHETLVSPFGCTWCVFQPIVDLLVWLLSVFYVALRDWGLAIIVLVVVVRLLLHPITKRSQRSMMRMAKLAPEMEKIKKKHGDDKEAMAKAMQEFYREHGMAALPLGCLPLLLQTPIWIALYSTLQAEFRLRHAPFLYGWTWIDDLAKPDNLIDFGTTINLVLFTIHGINILPILLGLVFWIQMKFQPTPAAMTPEQKMQQNMMKWMMVLMFPLFLYKAPSGLNLYILTSTLIGIWESKRVRDQFKREEEQQSQQQAPVIIPDKAPRGARGRKREQEREKAPARPLTGWRAKWAQIQEQVRQAQQEATKRAGERGKGKR